MYKLAEEDVQRFVDLPELGMGYQFVQRPAGRSNFGHYLLFNCTVLVAEEELTQPDQVRALYEAGNADGFDRLMARLDTAEGVTLGEDWGAFEAIAGTKPSPRWPGAQSGKALHSSPPFAKVLKEARVAVRFSAFQNDRRIRKDGSVARGTYAAPASELLHCITGFGACGRFALPNPSPAKWLSFILVPGGAKYLAGTVAPAFGQAGGGVEVELTDGRIDNPASMWDYQVFSGWDGAQFKTLNLYDDRFIEILALGHKVPSLLSEL